MIPLALTLAAAALVVAGLNAWHRREDARAELARRREAHNG
jgi:hypothetical protein